jgi:hypothetical protein
MAKASTIEIGKQNYQREPETLKCRVLDSKNYALKQESLKMAPGHSAENFPESDHYVDSQTIVCVGHIFLLQC